MTKGYCDCGGVMDQVEFHEYGMCERCHRKLDRNKSRIKHKNIMIRKGAFDFYYTCKTLEWNYWLNRYYPSAELIMTIEHLNNGFKLKLN